MKKGECGGWCSLIGLVLVAFVAIPGGIAAGSIGTPTSLAWGLPVVVIPMLIALVGVFLVR